MCPPQQASFTVVTVPDGLSKPYMDNNGAIWVKSGSDKRKVTAREEMQRMFQRAQLVHGDDIPVPGTSIADIDLEYFRWFFKIRFEQELEDQDLSLGKVLSNMRLLSNDLLTVTAVLLFTKDPRVFLPVFHVKLQCVIPVTTFTPRPTWTVRISPGASRHSLKSL